MTPQHRFGDEYEIYHALEFMGWDFGSIDHRMRWFGAFKGDLAGKTLAVGAYVEKWENGMYRGVSFAERDEAAGKLHKVRDKVARALIRNNYNFLIAVLAQFAIRDQWVEDFKRDITTEIASGKTWGIYNP